MFMLSAIFDLYVPCLMAQSGYPLSLSASWMIFNFLFLAASGDGMIKARRVRDVTVESLC